MKNRVIPIFFLIHFSLSVALFLALSTWTLGTEDGAMAPGKSASADASLPASAPLAMRWTAVLVHYLLLQPLAHWVLRAGVIVWWTWPGLLALLGLVAFNSAVVSGAVGIGLGKVRGSGRFS